MNPNRRPPENPEWEEYFEYLDNLRESGVTNMWGGAPYLQEAFDMTRTEARTILLAWMKSFDGATRPL